MKTKTLLLLFALLSIFSTGIVVYAENESEIIATYADSWKKENPYGWKHFYSKNGGIGNPANYVPLTYKVTGAKKSWWWANYYTEKSGKVKAGYNNTIPPTANREFQNNIISSYTFAKDYNNLWITNGNIVNIPRIPKEKLSIKIFLNDKLKFSEEAKMSRKPMLFQCSLGNIKKNDIVYVAIGSRGTKNSNSYKLYYTIEAFPAGKGPEFPVNIIRPGITTASPVLDYNGRPEQVFIQRHQKQCSQALKSPPKLIFLGDSITARWDFKMVKNGELLKYKPANFGVGGDWIQNVLWRLENGVMDKVKPQAIVLLIGTNNVSHKFSVKEITEGIKEIVAVIKKKTPDTKIIIMGIFPRGKSIHNNHFYENIKKINKNIAKMTDGKNIFYLDIGKKLVEPDGTITKEMMKDGLHIGSKGYEIWAKALQPVLDKILSERKE